MRTTYLLCLKKACVRDVTYECIPRGNPDPPLHMSGYRPIKAAIATRATTLPPALPQSIRLQDCPFPAGKGLFYLARPSGDDAIVYQPGVFFFVHDPSTQALRPPLASRVHTGLEPGCSSSPILATSLCSSAPGVLDPCGTNI